MFSAKNKNAIFFHKSDSLFFFKIKKNNAKLPTENRANMLRSISSPDPMNLWINAEYKMSKGGFL